MLNELENILKDVLCENDIEGIKYEEIDSLEKLEFLFRVENQFNVSILKKELNNIQNLKQLAELINQKINSNEIYITISGITI